MAEVVALYKYSYVYEGKTITFKKGEKFQLLDKPNGDWWHVRRWHEEGKAEDIYVPANYVKEEEKPKEENTAAPLYENMSDLAASYNKTKEAMASADGKKDKILPPPVRQKPTRSSDKSVDKAHNGHIPRQGQKTAPGSEKETMSPERVRKGSYGEANSPRNTHKMLEAIAGKPRSKTVADDSSTSLDKSPQETSLDRIPQGTVARLLANSMAGGPSDSKAPPPSVKPKRSGKGHAPLSRSSSDVERASTLFKPPSSLSPAIGGEVSTFVPPAPADMKRPPRTHSYEPVTLPLTKTPSPENGELTSTVPKVMIPSGLAAAIASKVQSVPSSSPTSTVTSTTLTSTPSSSSSLPEGWHETKTEDGRVYYYNSTTRDTSWTFPVESTTDSPSHQSAAASNDSSASSSPKKKPTIEIEKVAPRGWTKEINPLTQTPIFTNSRTRERWGIASDESGLFYFYNTANPSVTLRDLPPVMDEAAMRSLSEPGESSIYDSLTPVVQSAPQVQLRVKAPTSDTDRTRNMEARNSMSYDLWSSRLTTVLKKHGYLQKKRIHDPSGKKLRNEKWVSLFVVLDENKMLFYRDHKSKEAPGAKPLSNFWLLQANISCIPNPKEKKAKNVFQVSSSMGEQFYLQADTPAMMNEWFSVVQTAIDHTNADYKKNPDKYADVVRADLDPHHGGHPPLGRKASAPIAGYSYDDDNEEESQGPDRTVRIRGRLKKLIARRPEADVLRRTGIMQETVFGCDLSKLVEREKSPVPRFLKHFIEHIEKTGLTIVGIYRLSGNAAEIQKLRYLVEESPLVDLEDPVWADVNIVTGCLKLFLRELPDPLIPFKQFRSFIDAGRNPPAQRISAIATEVSKLPEANYQTLKTLVIHLRKVVEFGHTNRMQSSNLGIVFGPTVMRAETDSLEMAALMPVQNGIMELMISEFDKIFKK